MIINNLSDFTNPNYRGNLSLTLTSDNSHFDAIIVKERAPRQILDLIKTESTLIDEIKSIQDQIENTYSLNKICMYVDSICGMVWDYLDCLTNREMDDYDMDKVRAFIRGGNYTESPLDQVVDNLHAIDACINEVCDECQQLDMKDVSIDTLAAHIKSATHNLKYKFLFINFSCTKREFMNTLEKNEIDELEVIKMCDISRTISKAFLD